MDPPESFCKPARLEILEDYLCVKNVCIINQAGESERHSGLEERARKQKMDKNKWNNWNVFKRRIESMKPTGRT